MTSDTAGFGRQTGTGQLIKQPSGLCSRTIQPEVLCAAPNGGGTGVAKSLRLAAWWSGANKTKVVNRDRRI